MAHRAIRAGNFHRQSKNSTSKRGEESFLEKRKPLKLDRKKILASERKGWKSASSRKEGSELPREKR